MTACYTEMTREQLLALPKGVRHMVYDSVMVFKTDGIHDGSGYPLMAVIGVHCTDGTYVPTHVLSNGSDDVVWKMEKGLPIQWQELDVLHMEVCHGSGAIHFHMACGGLLGIKPGPLMTSSCYLTISRKYE